MVFAQVGMITQGFPLARKVHKLEELVDGKINESEIVSDDELVRAEEGRELGSTSCKICLKGRRITLSKSVLRVLSMQRVVNARDHIGGAHFSWVSTEKFGPILAAQVLHDGFGL